MKRRRHSTNSEQRKKEKDMLHKPCVQRSEHWVYLRVGQWGQEHPNPAIFDLASRIAMLHTDIGEFLATLAKTGFVNHHDCARIAELLQVVGVQIIAYQVRVPDGIVE
jgi:hypothetical protein